MSNIMSEFMFDGMSRANAEYVMVGISRSEVINIDIL